MDNNVLKKCLFCPGFVAVCLLGGLIVAAGCSRPPNRQADRDADPQPTPGSERVAFRGPDKVAFLVPSPDGHYLAASFEKGTVVLWHVERGAEAARFASLGQPSHQFDPHKAPPNLLRLVDPNKPAPPIMGPDDPRLWEFFTRLPFAFSGKGEVFAWYGSEKAGMHLWGVEQRKEVAFLDSEHVLRERIQKMATTLRKAIEEERPKRGEEEFERPKDRFLPDRYLATQRVAPHLGLPILAVAVTDDEVLTVRGGGNARTNPDKLFGIVRTARKDGSHGRWSEFDRWSEFYRGSERDRTKPLAPLRLEVRRASFNSTATLLIADIGQGQFRVWDVATGELRLTLELGTKYAGPFALSSSLSILAAVREDGSVVLWNFVHGKSERELKGFAQPVEALAFSADGMLLATASKRKAKEEGSYEVKLFDVTTGQERGTLPLDGCWWVTALGFVKGERSLAVGTIKGEVSFWTVPLALEK